MKWMCYIQVDKYQVDIQVCECVISLDEILKYTVISIT